MASILIVVFYLVIGLILKFIFPSGKEFIDYLETLYGRFGYEIITIASMFEALIVVNFFVPGVLAIGFGVIFAKLGDLDLTWVIVASSFGAILGYTLSYFLGKFGFGQILEKLGYKKDMDKAKSKIERFDFKTYALGFIHPNVGAVVSVVSGILKIDFKNFLILASLSTIVWYILWGLLIFALGNVFLTIFSKYGFMLFLLVGAIWLMVITFGQIKKRRR